MHRLYYAEWGAREWRGAVGAITLARIRSGPQLDALHDRLARIVGNRPIHLLNAGRNAIRLALEVFGEARSGRDRVIVPGYICPSVVDAVLACGLTPVAADIGADLNVTADSVQGAIDDRTLAVICPHMYGCPAPISAVERICRDRGIYLIDDAAQVLGVPVDGRPLGTFGDAGVFSFNQSKAVVTGHRGSGGILVINNSALRDSAVRQHALLPPARSVLGPLVHFLWNYQFEPYTGRTGYFFDRFAARVRGRDGSADYYRPSRMANLWAAIALPQLSRLDKMIAGRIRVARDFQEELSLAPRIGFPQYAEGRYLSRIVLALPAGTDLALLRSALLERRVATRRAYATPDAVISDAPNAAAITKRLLEVPSRSTMERSEIRAICGAIAQCLGAITRRS